MKKFGWEGDWRRLLASRLQATGAKSLRAFLSSHPGEPYESLSRLLGEEVVPIQVLQAHIDESCGEPNEALDSLARLLRQSMRRGGWAVGPRWREKMASAFVWFGRWGDFNELSELGNVLLDMELPSGWIPSTGEDEHLQEAASRFGLERLRRAIAPSVSSSGSGDESV